MAGHLCRFVLIRHLMNPHRQNWIGGVAVALLAVAALLWASHRPKAPSRVVFLGMAQNDGGQVARFRLEVPSSIKVFGAFLRIVDDSGSRPITTDAHMPSVVVDESGVTEFAVSDLSPDPVW
jgi:hypothetical protein